MKIIRLKVEGLSLFKENLDISFYATGKVTKDQQRMMYALSPKFYLNCANAFIGKNASGKTTILHVISLALNILNNEPINHIHSKYVLSNSNKVTFSIYHTTKQNEVCCLKTTILNYKTVNGDISYKIVNEQLFVKSLLKVNSKQNLTTFKEKDLIQERNSQEEYLLDDVSMIVARNKKQNEHIEIGDLLNYTNINKLNLSEDIPVSYIKFLDPTVEYLKIEKNNSKPLIRLKFYGKDEMILNNFDELELYLSSGTIKGITMFIRIQNILKNGGCLLVDEIENHFNKEIVSSIVRLFMDLRINKNGAVLIYSTHYPEILDIYDRNDSIYITDNSNGLIAVNLQELLKRRDIKKSDAYQSGMLGNTNPYYEDYMILKKYIQNIMNSGDL